MGIRYKDEITCTVVGLAVNALLTAFKFAAGVLGNSQALVTDAIHSLSDEFATLVTLAALKIAKVPPDEEHPYGHGNIEVIVSWFVAVLLLLTGGYLGFSAVHSLHHKHYLQPTQIALWGAAASVLIKEALYRYTILVADETGSPVLKANAYDHRSDAFSSIGACVGIGGALLGYPILDPLAGVVISLFIIKMGLDIITDTTHIVMDASPPKEFIEKARAIIAESEDIRDSYDLRIHRIGREQIMDVSIAVDGDMTVKQGHDAAAAIRKKLIIRFPRLQDVVVHVEPHVPTQGS